MFYAILHSECKIAYRRFDGRAFWNKGRGAIGRPGHHGSGLGGSVFPRGHAGSREALVVDFSEQRERLLALVGHSGFVE